MNYSHSREKFYSIYERRKKPDNKEYIYTAQTSILGICYSRDYILDKNQRMY